MKLAAVPNLSELLADPGKVLELPVEAVPSLRGELARLDTMLLSRILTPLANGNGHPEGDRFIKAPEVAATLGIAVKSVYKRNYPFEVKGEGREVSYSFLGMQEYMRRRAFR